MFVELVMMTSGRMGKPWRCTIQEKTGNVLTHPQSYLLQVDVHGTMEKASQLVGVPMAAVWEYWGSSNPLT